MSPLATSDSQGRHSSASAARAEPRTACSASLPSLPCHEVLRETDDFLRLQIQREVPGVQDVYLGSRVILLVSFSTGYGERSVVTPPENKQRRFVVAKPLLPFRVGLDVILIVVKEVQLNIPLSRLVQEIILVHPQIGVVLRGIRRSADVPLAGCLKGQQVASHLGLVSRPVLPE